MGIIGHFLRSISASKVYKDEYACTFSRAALEKLNPEAQNRDGKGLELEGECFLINSSLPLFGGEQYTLIGSGK